MAEFSQEFCRMGPKGAEFYKKYFLLSLLIKTGKFLHFVHLLTYLFREVVSLLQSQNF